MTDPSVLDQANSRARELNLESANVGVPGWEGELVRPVEDLAWFAEMGFYIFDVLDGKGVPGRFRRQLTRDRKPKRQ